MSVPRVLCVIVIMLVIIDIIVTNLAIMEIRMTANSIVRTARTVRTTA